MLKPYRLLFFAVWLILQSTASHANSGAGSSGGGRILKDAHNPWFLENTKQVHYCIVHENQAFSLEIDAIRQHIAKAFSFWKEQLQKGEYMEFPHFKPPYTSFRLGTQTFVETSCDHNSQIIFQLGSLSPQQKEKIENIESTIAEVVRTNYDRVNLHGSGFIYVAPDQGPQWEEAKVVPENTWSAASGKSFYFTVLHELGHVFGFPDTSNTPQLMTYDWVQMIIEYSRLAPQLLNIMREPEITKWTRQMIDDRGHCVTGGDIGFYEKWRERVLGVPAKEKRCEKIRITNELLELYAGSDFDQMKLVGSASFQNVSEESFQTLVSVWLPPGQNVYKKSSDDHYIQAKTFGSVRAILQEVKGTYHVHATGFKTPISIKFDPSDRNLFPSVIGVVDGGLITNLINPNLQDDREHSRSTDIATFKHY